jgi:hypothetical protein
VWEPAERREHRCIAIHLNISRPVQGSEIAQDGEPARSIPADMSTDAVSMLPGNRIHGRRARWSIRSCSYARELPTRRPGARHGCGAEDRLGGVGIGALHHRVSGRPLRCPVPRAARPATDDPDEVRRCGRGAVNRAAPIFLTVSQIAQQMVLLPPMVAGSTRHGRSDSEMTLERRDRGVVCVFDQTAVVTRVSAVWPPPSHWLSASAPTAAELPVHPARRAPEVFSRSELVETERGALARSEKSPR